MTNPFNILDQNGPQNLGHPVDTATLPAEVQDRIKSLITNNSTILFMKGSPDFPQCGFSANTVQILNTIGVKYKTFDILSDMDLRAELKVFSNWPTFPQLYFQGKLVGGNDIITEMFEEGELQKLLKNS